MKQIRIKDNSAYSTELFSDLPAITNRIANKTLKQLESEGVFVFPNTVRDANDLSEDEIIVRDINNSIFSGNVLGFIGFGDERLQIESRFATGDTDFFTQYMLESVLNIPNIVNLNTSAGFDTQLLNLLFSLFPYYLKRAFRKGLFKTYIKKEYNDSNVKGVIDVKRHIKSNIPFVGKIAYNQREYSFDNYLIELIRHTIEYIKSQPYGNKILRQINDEVKEIISATPGYKASERNKLIDYNKQHFVRHLYYSEYRALQELCILILRNAKHSVGLGTKQIYGILFDGAWLWEEYVNSLIQSDFYHPMNKANSGRQYLFANSSGDIFPDFIGKHDDNRIIADAKYKPSGNVNGKDYLQVLAYMLRFDAKKGLYLYPEVGDTIPARLFLNSGNTYENSVSPRCDIFVQKVGLKIPVASSYDDFVERMKISEDTFKGEIVSILSV